MSFYSKGNPHNIAVMASKSCNAVSSRDLYVPLTATVSVDTQARTFAIEVVATCYFGTRINIQNSFTNMEINGQSVSNKTIDAWVSQSEPGKELARVTINGTFNYEGVPSITSASIPFSGKMTYFKDVGCTQTGEISFQNEVSITIDNIDPYYTQPAVPTIGNVTSLDTALLVDLSTSSFGEGGGKYLYAEASKSNTFDIVKSSTPISALSGTCRIPNLQRNNKYYIRAVCANNNLTSYSPVQEASTLAASEVSDAWCNDSVTAVISVMGGNQIPVETDVYVGYRDKTSGQIDFNLRRTINGTGRTTASGLTVGVTEGYDELYVKTVSRTASGSYFSPVFTIQNPNEYGTSRSLSARISSISRQSATSVTVTTKTNSAQTPYTIDVYYRPVGIEEEWVSVGSATSSSSSATRTFTISNLIPNYAEYEVICVATATYQGEAQEYTSPEKKFFTIPTQVSNDTCDSLDYMTQLICQTYNSIKQGNITIYMNDDTKEWCEGEDGIPTLTSIMGRINRYMHSVGCVLCSMEGFIELLKESEENQVFMGQMGWVDCDDEPIDGSINPVISDGVHAAIEELISQVWHYVGSYDYFARTTQELNAQSGTATGQTAILGNKVYNWNGSSWVESGSAPDDDFGVIRVERGTYSGCAFYWFVNDWNRLDADTKEIEARLSVLESLNVVKSIDGSQYKIALADSSLTKTQINALIPADVNRDTVIILTDPALTDETQVTILEGGN